MGAGVGPLVAPAVFRIVVDFRDTSGAIKPIYVDPCTLKAPDRARGQAKRTPISPLTDRQLTELKTLGQFAERIRTLVVKTIPEDGATVALEKKTSLGVACHGDDSLTPPNAKVVWLPTRKDPGNRDSPITGGMYLISGDLSPHEAQALNCSMDSIMKAINVINVESTRVVLRASANIGPAANKESSDWGNKRDVSSTGTSVFCPAPAKPQ
jgi:hypothetical protein